MNTKTGTLVALLACAMSTGCDFLATQGPRGDRGERGPAGPQGVPGGSADDSASGSRLRRLYRKAEDGAKHFEGWHDPEIGGTCAFMVDVNGDDRCMPKDPRAVAIDLRYLDSKCTAPVAFIRTDDCGTLPPAFSYRIPGDCSWRARRLSYQVEAPAPVYGIVQDPNGDATCVEMNEPEGLYYKVEAEMDPEAFVEGTVEID